MAGTRVASIIAVEKHGPRKECANKVSPVCLLPARSHVVPRHSPPALLMQSFRLQARSRARPAPHSLFAGAQEAEEPLAPPPEQAPPSAEDCAASRALQDAGNAHAEQGRFPAALKEWERALKLTPHVAELHESMASSAAPGVRVFAATSADARLYRCPGAGISRNRRAVAGGRSR